MNADDPVKLAAMATKHLSPQAERLGDPLPEGIVRHPTQGHPITRERLRQIQERDRMLAERAATAEVEAAALAAAACDDGDGE